MKWHKNVVKSSAKSAMCAVQFAACAKRAAVCRQVTGLVAVPQKSPVCNMSISPACNGAAQLLMVVLWSTQDVTQLLMVQVLCSGKKWKSQPPKLEVPPRADVPTRLTVLQSCAYIFTMDTYGQIYYTAIYVHNLHVCRHRLQNL